MPACQHGISNGQGCAPCALDEARRELDVLKNVAAAWKDRAESAERMRDEAAAEAAACLTFLRSEMGWEEFRSEMLYGEAEPKKAAVSAQNAQKLRSFLAETGHARQILDRLEAQSHAGK